MRYWECVKSNNNDNFTVGKIYKTNNDCLNFITDIGFKFTNTKIGDLWHSKFKEVTKQKGEIKMDYKVGDKVKVIRATSGSYGADGKTGVITNEASNNGIPTFCNGINIDCGNGSIWRVGLESKLVKIGEEKTITISISDSVSTLTDGEVTVCINRHRTDKHSPQLATNYLFESYYRKLKEIESEKNEKYLYVKGIGQYGTLGEPTSLVDSIGRNLRVGDIVSVFDKSGNYYAKEFVCKKDGREFIMGFQMHTRDCGHKYYNYLLETSYKEVDCNTKLPNSSIKIINRKDLK